MRRTTPAMSPQHQWTGTNLPWLPIRRDLTRSTNPQTNISPTGSSCCSLFSRGTSALRRSLVSLFSLSRFHLPDVAVAPRRRTADEIRVSTIVVVWTYGSTMWSPPYRSFGRRKLKLTPACANGETREGERRGQRNIGSRRFGRTVKRPPQFVAIC